MHPTVFGVGEYMIIMITIITMIMITLKGSIQGFLQSSHSVSITYAQVARAQSCANHVQHTPGTYHMQHAVYHVVRRNNSAIKLDTVEIASII